MNMQVQLKLAQIQLCVMLQALRNTTLAVPALLAPGFSHCPELISTFAESGGSGRSSVIDRSVWWDAQVEQAYPVGLGLQRGNDSDVFSKLTRVLYGDDVSDGGLGKTAVLVFFVTALAMCTLALYVMHEACSACELAYLVAVCGGFVPDSWVRPQHHGIRVRTALRTSTARAGAAACMPILQVLVSGMAYACGVLLMAAMQFSTDVVQIIVNSVALVFVLELDDKFGELLSRQEAEDGPALTAGIVEVGPRHGNAWGSLYRLILLLLLGAMVFCILWSPSLMVTMSLVTSVPKTPAVMAGVALVSTLLVCGSAMVLMNMVYHHPLMVESNAKLRKRCRTFIALTAIGSCMASPLLFSKGAPLLQVLPPSQLPQQGPSSSGGMIAVVISAAAGLLAGVSTFLPAYYRRRARRRLLMDNQVQEATPQAADHQVEEGGQSELQDRV
jgi:hypothetical protein